MSLSELTASQLARIDAICLAYERGLRSGVEKEIEAVLAEASDLPAATLREELKAIRDELRPSRPRPLEHSPPVAAFESQATPTQGMPRHGWLPGGRSAAPPDVHPGDASAVGVSQQTSRETAEAVFCPGARLGPYRIEALIGQGGMGRVYRGRDERLERSVAIKVLADDWAQKPERVERFERESRAVAALRHSNIVFLYDVGTHAGRPYAVMELLEGETLRHRLDRGEITLEEIRQIGVQIASALSAAHDGGIVHRDLKPENLILLPSEASGSAASNQDGVTVKLLDFGLSRAAEGELVGTDDQTASGVVMGTAGYMAPEQARGLKATPAADIFSLGCVLYECFYSRKAFAENTLAESLGAVLHKTPEVDPRRAAEAPALARLISACLAKEIERRPPTASAVAGQLMEMELTAFPGEEAPSSNSQSDADAAAIGASPSPRAFGAITAVDRRRWFELVGGAAAGIVSVASMPSWFETPIPPIDSIAVLPFYNLGGEQRQPVGGRQLIEEERVAAMLVNELAKLPTLKVRPFRPMTVAETRAFPSEEEFRSFAEELGVGGLVLVEVVGSASRPEVNLQLVNAGNGDVLWGERFSYSGEPASLLERTDTASILAEKIGQQVAAIKATGQTKNEDAFFCLVRGKARFDPDSEDGMRSAINCFKKAASLDATFVDAHAGLALAAMALAARTKKEESQQRVSQARDAVKRAMDISAEGSETSSAPLVNLASGIVSWQADHEFAKAERFFLAALRSLPNYWQAHHEYALYQAARGRLDDAVELAKRAVTLNPMGSSLRLDVARLRWFQGDAKAALLQSASIRREEPNHRFAKGLAIDVHEQREEYQQAAELSGLTNAASLDRRSYFNRRKDTLVAVPYGPFGPTMNRAILEARAMEMDEVGLQQIVDEQPPMLALLLAAHPAFAEQRSWTPAKAFVPASAAATSARRPVS